MITVMVEDRSDCACVVAVMDAVEVMHTVEVTHAVPYSSGDARGRCVVRLVAVKVRAR